MKHKKGDIVKVYVVEKTNQYGSVYYSSILPDNWSVSIWFAEFYKYKQDCKNKASELIERSIKLNQKYPVVFNNVDDITVRELEIKFVN